jgi:hypothetical protein
MSRVYSAMLLAGKQISNLRIISVGILTSVAILTVILEFLPGLKANSLSRRDGHFFTGAGIAPDPAFAWLNDENAKPPQLDSIAAREGVLHRIEERLDCLFSFQLRDAGLVGKAIDDIEFDHGNVASGSDEHSLAFNLESWLPRDDRKARQQLSSFTNEPVLMQFGISVRQTSVCRRSFDKLKLVGHQTAPLPKEPANHRIASV